MLKLNLSKQCQKFLKSLPTKHGRQIAVKLQMLLKNPSPPDSQPLKGFPYWRADCGEYRVIDRVEKETLFIVLIGKRNDEEVYKKLGRF